jgi:hypothetical protein
MTKMTITFECENIADLKLQIQEYSLAHLNLNLKAMAEGMVAKQAVILTPEAPPLEPKKRPGRPTGWRKEKPGDEEAAPSETVPLPATSEPAAEPSPGPSLDKERAKKAIVELAKLRGLVAAEEALKKYGADHLNKIAPEHLEDLAKYCEELVNGTN